ncbi:Multidrug/Oligosaccharidyl-lipid/Polysaccharide (MOP) Flippase transporter [Phytophthora megakarya]|uniref:Multidrug/Oligosaccharidyl-lipid/Polysaccharide (MOP) Flippase transporter n=1 Tax=Phytophthora megakarya TaxID=4795 RepID=A0A225URG4_9STRA|nr:Multidrug/Oligosaccharidyl-lipid/Polysaccharide (MOP) Flippase transporter [Phytophthora megakarya]
MLGSLRSSALGPPMQIPRGPASRAPRAGLLRQRALAPAHLRWSFYFTTPPLFETVHADSLMHSLQKDHYSGMCTH